MLRKTCTPRTKLNSCEPANLGTSLELHPPVSCHSRTTVVSYKSTHNHRCLSNVPQSYIVHVNNSTSSESGYSLMTAVQHIKPELIQLQVSIVRHFDCSIAQVLHSFPQAFGVLGYLLEQSSSISYCARAPSLPYNVHRYGTCDVNEHSQHTSILVAAQARWRTGAYHLHGVVNCLDLVLQSHFKRHMRSRDKLVRRAHKPVHTSHT